MMWKTEWKTRGACSRVVGGTIRLSPVYTLGAKPSTTVANHHSINYRIGSFLELLHVERGHIISATVASQSALATTSAFKCTFILINTHSKGRATSVDHVVAFSTSHAIVPLLSGDINATAADGKVGAARRGTLDWSFGFYVRATNHMFPAVHRPVIGTSGWEASRSGVGEVGNEKGNRPESP